MEKHCKFCAECKNFCQNWALKENFIQNGLTFLCRIDKIKKVRNGRFERFIPKKSKFEEDIMKKLFAMLLAVVMVVGLCFRKISLSLPVESMI